MFFFRAKAFKFDLKFSKFERLQLAVDDFSDEKFEVCRLSNEKLHSFKVSQVISEA